MRRPQLSPLRLVSIREDVDLNLGDESPESILKPAVDSDGDTHDEWRKSGIAVHTDVPMRKRTWRSASFSERKKRGRVLARELVDRDCGIW